MLAGRTRGTVIVIIEAALRESYQWCGVLLGSGAARRCLQLDRRETEYCRRDHRFA